MESKQWPTILVAIAVCMGAWFVVQNSTPQTQEGVISEHFKKPIKSPVFNKPKVGDAVSDEAITLSQTIQPQSAVQNIEPLRSQAKNDIREKRLVVGNTSQLDKLSRRYGLQHLPNSILLNNIGNSASDRDTQALLRNSRRFIASQLLRNNNDTLLIELAQHAGVNDRLIQQFKAYSRDLQSRDMHPKGLDARQRSLSDSSSLAIGQSRPASNGTQSYLLNSNTSPNQYPASNSAGAALDQAWAREPSQQRESTRLKQTIPSGVDDLRRSLVLNTSNGLAKLQLKQLGITN